jgi:serine/threonine protein kinase
MLTVPVAFPVGVHISEDCKSFIRCCLVVDEAKRVCIEELDKHQWLRKRWVQTRAQESAKKALNAPIV